MLAQSKVIRAREVIKDGDYSPHFSTFRREKHEIELSARLPRKKQQQCTWEPGCSTLLCHGAARAGRKRVVHA
jgi:hypothetical protein